MSFQSTDDRDKFFLCTEAQEALRIITELRDAGFVAYLAGGCVRDALLGRQPKDYDVATNATPDSVRQVFGRSKTLAFGASFGVIGVLPKSSRPRGGKAPTIQPTEVATFRSDGEYSDGRRPDSVHFGEAEQDALRRDFTINGLFYDPGQHRVVDYVGGQADLEKGLLRTIGDADQRIEEDKLRMLRAVRFATTLRFQVDPDTVEAIQEHSRDIDKVSGERIGAEMRRVLTSPDACDGLRHLQAFDLHHVVLPELSEFDWQLFRSVTSHLDDRQFSSSLACMLLAMSDPVKALGAITRRWKLSNEERRQALAAVEHWPVIRDAHRRDWSAVQPTLIHRDAATIVSVAAAMVAAAQSDSGGVRLSREALAWPPEKLDPPTLLTGDDLRDQGVPAGPAYRTILQKLRDAQLDGKIGSREEAIAAINKMV